VRGLQNEFRDARIRRLRRQGRSVPQIMAEMGVSRRTVYRVLALGKESSAAA
jgi:transposase